MTLGNPTIGTIVLVLIKEKVKQPCAPLYDQIPLLKWAEPLQSCGPCLASDPLLWAQEKLLNDSSKSANVLSSPITASACHRLLDAGVIIEMT